MSSCQPGRQCQSPAELLSPLDRLIACCKAGTSSCSQLVELTTRRSLIELAIANLPHLSGLHAPALQAAPIQCPTGHSCYGFLSFTTTRGVKNHTSGSGEYEWEIASNACVGSPLLATLQWTRLVKRSLQCLPIYLRFGELMYGN